MDPSAAGGRIELDGRHRRRRSRTWWRPSLPAVVCLLVLTALAIGARSAVAEVSADRATQQLTRRSLEVSTLLDSALAETRSTLTVLGALAGAGQQQAFASAAQALVSPSVRSIGQVIEVGGAAVVETGAGDLAAGQQLTADRADLVRRALATEGFVGGVVHLDGEARLGFALHPAGADPVVLREVAIQPDRAQSTVRGQAFSDLDASLYASAQPVAGQLVLTTRQPALTQGHRQTVQVGPDRWVLITRAHDPLDGRLAAWLPSLVLVGGILLALSITGVVDTLARRRRYAMELVAERTADLEASLRQQTQLEAGQRAAREEAEQANQAKSEFLSRMSHELRTPLNGVLGFAQLLDMDELSPDQRDSTQQILKGGWHLLDLINEVLDISRIESGTLSLSPEPVLACEVIEESVALIRPLAEQRPVHVFADEGGGCDVHVFADRQRVKQVVLNLLSNAVKYNRVGGTVAVSCRNDGTTLHIDVVDTGPGLAAADLELVFMPFERLGAQHTEVEGTGIGLALSKRLAEAMGGTLSVTSEVGRGSTFTLALPVVEGQVARFERLSSGRLAAPAVEAAAPARKIVCIEDNLSNLRLVERVLASRPEIEIVAAAQGRLGLELARHHRPAAVLLDVNLPDVDGADVLRQLRDDPLTSSVPVVVVSADATPGQVARLRNEGAYAYLTKPLDVPELLRILDQILLAEQR